MPLKDRLDPMLIVLSPAKTLDYESECKVKPETTPEWIDQSELLVTQLKKKNPKQIAALMGVSDKLAELNHLRYQDWIHPMPDEATRAAVLAFKGDVYLGLQAETMTVKQLQEAQLRLRILSGLYGVLRPLDAMLPYRLEMGTKLKTRRGKDLYAFWGSRITESLNDQLETVDSQLLLNLASGEYFKSIRTDELNAEVVAPVFKDLSNGKYKVLSFFAKQARGAMAAWVVRKKVKTLKKLQQFDAGGYCYDPETSTPEKPVFQRANR